MRKGVTRPTSAQKRERTMKGIAMGWRPIVDGWMNRWMDGWMDEWVAL